MPRSVVTIAWWLVAWTALLGVVLRPWVGDALVLTRYIGYVMPWLLVALAPGAAWAWLTHRRPLAGILALTAVAIAALHARHFLPRRTAPPDGAVVLDFMSYNVWSLNEDVAAMARVIRERRPDVLLLQEIEPKVLVRLTAALADLYGPSAAHVAYDPELLQAIVSRHPIESWTSLERTAQALAAVIRTPGGPVTVFDVHALRTGGWRERYAELDALLRESVLATPGPVILGGDFNAPERSQPYALLASALRNAHDAAGFGFGFTYPASGLRPLGLPLFPLVRIDHLFFNDGFVALRAGTIEDSGGSDHRPVFATLALRTSAEAPRASVPPRAAAPGSR
jgi:vancomycin resistance protein VanJ